VKDWVSGCRNVKVEVVGRRGRGRGKKTWMEVVEDDLRRNRSTKDMVKDTDSWRTLMLGKRLTCASVENGRKTKMMMMKHYLCYLRMYRHAESSF